jgi:hypothetical protein
LSKIQSCLFDSHLPATTFLEGINMKSIFHLNRPSRYSKLYVTILTFLLLSLQCHGFAVNSRVMAPAAASLHKCQMSTVMPQVAPTPAVPELRAPSDLFNNVVNIGATKAKLGPMKTFLLGIKSGCHISFGKLYFSCESISFSTMR